MKDLINSVIYSKNTMAKGKITACSQSHVFVTFIEEEDPIKITFEQFLKNILCDKETKEEIERKIEEQKNECKE